MGLRGSPGAHSRLPTAGSGGAYAARLTAPEAGSHRRTAGEAAVARRAGGAWALGLRPRIRVRRRPGSAGPGPPGSLRLAARRLGGLGRLAGGCGVGGGWGGGGCVTWSHCAWQLGGSARSAGGCGVGGGWGGGGCAPRPRRASQLGGSARSAGVAARAVRVVAVPTSPPRRNAYGSGSGHSAAVVARRGGWGGGAHAPRLTPSRTAVVPGAWPVGRRRRSGP